MKKIISILLIAVFFTAQYARQLAYLECKLAVLSAADTVNCDCEKQTAIDKMADEGIPASKGHSHISVDEYFSYPANESASHVLPAVPVKFTTFNNMTAPAGNHAAPYRPPQA